MRVDAVPRKVELPALDEASTQILTMGGLRTSILAGTAGRGNVPEYDKMGGQKKKAQKERERKERIRQEKHERRSQPKVLFGPEDEESVAPPPPAFSRGGSRPSRDCTTSTS
jgi:hypothetical protein